MSGTLRISLRAGERIYINGAVLRVDRKVSIDLLNSVTFLLEQHVMKPEDTTTPLKQLYFMIQTALLEPSCAGDADRMSQASLVALRAAFQNAKVLTGLKEVEELLGRQRRFECLRVIRGLFPVEAEIMGIAPAAAKPVKAAAAAEERTAACR